MRIWSILLITSESKWCIQISRSLFSYIKPHASDLFCKDYLVDVHCVVTEFEKYIPDIYPAELQLNKANTSDKETSFLDLNIK